ncbi:hypothetical protein RUND412_004365 [Rhizina undulata]
MEMQLFSKKIMILNVLMMKTWRLCREPSSYQLIKEEDLGAGHSFEVERDFGVAKDDVSIANVCNILEMEKEEGGEAKKDAASPAVILSSLESGHVPAVPVPVPVPSVPVTSPKPKQTPESATAATNTLPILPLRF